MQYQIIPIGEMWQNGSFCIPTKVATDYIKLASEYQIKALLIVLSSNGTAESKAVARVLGCTESDAEEFLDFWVEEGFLARNGEVVAPKTAPVVEEKKEVKKKVEALPVPTLTPKDIVDLCRDNHELAELLRNAEEVVGKILSHIDKQMIVNMHTYYGLPADVVLVLLQYRKREVEHGRALGNAYVSAMAKNWSEEGIVTLELADQKLHELEASDRLWSEIVAMSGIAHRNPTQKQRDMIRAWYKDFSIEMIGLACDAMKENADKPSLKYIDGVLKNWKKKNITTPQAVEEDSARHKQSNTTQPKIDKTYDIDTIEQKAMFNDDYDI